MKYFATLNLAVLLTLPTLPVSAADVPPKAAEIRQIILLKLDDVIARRVGAKAVSDRWLKVHDYLKTQNIKGSFGIITESLEKDNAMYFQWLKDVQAAGLIEFWMHGYHMKTAAEPGEFEQGTAEEQRAILAKGEKLAKEKLGFTLPAFGPHWSGTTEATDEAMEKVPEVTIWLYGPEKPRFYTRLSIPRVMALENPTFVPDLEKFKTFYEAKAAKREVLVLQGHPEQWDDKRWAGFTGIIDFLKTKNVEFMTPSEYLKKTQSKQP